jgi:Cu/Ag efflux protein CusF
MRSPSPRRSTAPLLFAAAAVLAALTACPGPPQNTLGPATRRYVVRGEVVRVADEGGRRSVLIRHEAIPDFVDRSGARVGMASMTMPFPAGPRVAALELRPGDKILFRFGIDWERNVTELEEVERLPAGTALTLGSP